MGMAEKGTLMLDSGLAWVKSHPKVAIGGGLGIVAVAVVAHKRAMAAKASSASAANVSPTGQASGDVTNPLGGTQPGTIAGVAYTPGPTVTKTVQPTTKPGFVSVILTNPKTGLGKLWSFRSLNDATKSCPPGFTLVVGTSGKPECVNANQPAEGGARYTQPKAVPSKITKAASSGQAGEGDPALPSLSVSSVPLGFVSPWTRAQAMRLPMRYGGGWDDA